MNNAKKIEAIRDLLAKPNCAGVKVEWTSGHASRQTTTITNENMDFIKFAIYSGLEIEILDYRPIAIELEPLEDGSKAWALGEVVTVNHVIGMNYTVENSSGLLGVFGRHELIKVNV